jgi:hypothetical protein
MDFIYFVGGIVVSLFGIISFVAGVGFGISLEQRRPARTSSTSCAPRPRNHNGQRGFLFL